MIFNKPILLLYKYLYSKSIKTMFMVERRQFNLFQAPKQFVPTQYFIIISFFKLNCFFIW